MLVQEGEDVHTFNRKHQMNNKQVDSEIRDPCSPSLANIENSRVDTGHFNSKAGLYQNDMNIMTSLHMDASPGASRSHSSIGSAEGIKSKDTTMIHLKKSKDSKDKYATKQPGTYSNLEE